MLIIVQVKRDVIIEAGTVFVLSDTELRVMGKNNQRVPCDVLTTQDQLSTTPSTTPKKKPSAKQQSTKGEIKYPEKGITGAILNLLRTKGKPLSLAQINAELPTLNPNSISGRVSTLFQAGLLKRTDNGSSPYTYTAFHPNAKE